MPPSRSYRRFVRLYAAEAALAAAERGAARLADAASWPDAAAPAGGPLRRSEGGSISMIIQVASDESAHRCVVLLEDLSIIQALKSYIVKCLQIYEYGTFYVSSSYVAEDFSGPW